MHRTKQRAVGKRLALFTLAGLGVAGVLALPRRPLADLHGKVVVITGSSGGLGLALAEECAQQGARVVLCARDGQRLAAARQRISAYGGDTLALPCDVTDQYQVEHMVAMALEEFGAVDILINTASLMKMGLVATSEFQDFADAMDVSFWGTVYASLAVLPHMRERGRGHIVNITSIGGKVSVPRMLPFSSAKFAAVGFSTGLRAELAQAGITVTTVLPDLPITGTAPTLADQPGEQPAFDIKAALTNPAPDVARTARQIVMAIRRGDAEVALSWQARVFAVLYGLLGARTGDLLDLVARYLAPSASTGTPVAPSAPTMDAPIAIPITRTDFLKNLSKEGL